MKFNAKILGFAVAGVSVITAAYAATTEFVDDVVISTSKTTVPVLSATGQGGVVFGGVLNTGTTPAAGAGVRMMWVPRRAAFRVGMVTGTQWDLESVNRYSVAMGYNVIASGESSIALGDTTTASGESSFAGGRNSSATATYGWAFGNGVTAIGEASFASGNSTTAAGSRAFAIGSFTTADGNYAIASGYKTVSSGTASFSGGEESSATGAYSLAFGFSSTASGTYSSAIGRAVASSWYGFATGRSTVTADYAAAFGRSDSASYSGMTIGRFNLVEGSFDSWVPTDPIFVIGNGTSSSSRSNAFVVKKNGDVEMNGKVTLPRQGDVLMGEFGN